MMMTRIATLATCLALVSTGVAGAQTPPGTNGITVTGRATVRHAADAARIQISLPGRRATPSDDADKLVAILKEHGVTDATVGLGQMQIFNAIPTVVTGTLRNPTIERVRDIGRAIDAAFPGPSPFPVPMPMTAGGQVFAPAPTTAPGPVAREISSPVPGAPVIRSVTYPVIPIAMNVLPVLDDCSAIEGRAEAAAIADARTRATRAAANAGVRLGDILNVVVNAYPPAGCPTHPDALSAYIGSVQSDPAHPFDVIVTTQTIVTYAIVGPNGPVRRRTL